MATSSSKKKTGSVKKPAAAPKKQPAKKQPAAAPTPAPTAPTWPYAIVCIVLSLLAFLGLFHAEGVIIDGFAGFLSGIMGWGYWAFPFAMLLLAWVFVRNPERHFGLRVTASLLIAPLFGTIVHLMACRVPFTAQTFGAIVGQLYDGGKALTSGGVISGGVGYLLKAGISVYAALPLTMAAFVACVLGSMDLTVGKIVTWWRAHREAQYIPDDGDQPLFDDEDEPAVPPQPEPQRRARRAAPDKPVAKKKLIDIPVEDTPSEPDDEPIDPIPVKKAARGGKKPAPAEATQNVQPLSVEEAADICGVDVTAAQEIHDPPKPSKKAASAAVAAETAAITSAIERENADHSAYQLPPVSFLRAGKKDQTDATEEIRFNRDRLDTALSSFGVNATIRDVTRGPTVTRYDLELEAGVKLNKITNLSGDLALALGVENVRIAPIPDKISTVGIEVPNKIVSAVCLRDIIDSQRIPVVRLVRIFRQAQKSRIVMNAHTINQGRFPDTSNGRDTDFFFMREDDPERAAETIVRLVKERLPRAYRESPDRIQVLTPMQRGVVGAANLNLLLQQALNPSGPSLGRGGYTYRQGDRVMQLRNNYDKDVFNGDLGYIREVDTEDRMLTVDFDGKKVEYDVTELDELTLAYATTIHKAQGSEYPIVVMPVLMTHFVMLQRNLIYTGITRAKKICVLIGAMKALAYAVRDMSVLKRNTSLRERLNPSLTTDGKLRG